MQRAHHLPFDTCVRVMPAVKPWRQKVGSHAICSSKCQQSTKAELHETGCASYISSSGALEVTRSSLVTVDLAAAAASGTWVAA